MHTNATSTLDNSMLLASPYYYSKMARSPDGRWQKSKAAKACSWTRKKTWIFLMSSKPILLYWCGRSMAHTLFSLKLEWHIPNSWGQKKLNGYQNVCLFFVFWSTYWGLIPHHHLAFPFLALERHTATCIPLALLLSYCRSSTTSTSMVLSTSSAWSSPDVSKS